MKYCISREKNSDLRAAYKEMLDSCLAHPDKWEWYAMWMIMLKDGTRIGDLCFKGIDGNGVTEIGYGVMQEYQGLGYATEAVEAILKWAFSHAEITTVEAETEPDNIASQRVLEKCGFIPNGKVGNEGPRFSLMHL